VRSFAFKLVFHLLISDGLFSFSQLLNFDNIAKNTIVHDYTALCYMQAIVSTFAGLSSILWTTVISYSLYKATIKGLSNLNALWNFFRIYAFGLPFLCMLVPIFTNDYGPSGVIC